MASSIFEIDSFLLSIPIEKALGKDYDLNAEKKMLGVRDVTGEVEEEYERRITPRSVTRGRFNHGFIKNGQFKITVHVPTILGDKPLTLSNVLELWHYFVDRGLDITLRDFISGTVTDLDVKTDILVPSSKLFLEELLEMNEFAPRKLAKDFKGNMLYAGKRTGSTYQDPYFKVYDKDVQLMEVYNQPKPNDQKGDKMRLEMTIKNKQHLGYMGVDNNTLGRVLSTDQDIYKREFKKQISRIAYHNVDQIINDKRTTPEMLKLIVTIRKELKEYGDVAEVIRAYRKDLRDLGLSRGRVDQKVKGYKKLVHLVNGDLDGNTITRIVG